MAALDMHTYYARLRETDRLTRSPTGRLELQRTRELLEKFLPGTDGPLRILDVGGATGVHAAWLAALGHRVEVVDPVAEQTSVASTLPGVTARVGDARDLPHPDASYDVVLLLGPLYHLVDRADRVRALAEARRVARPGGVVAAATITRHASLLDLGTRGLLTPESLVRVRGTIATGRHDPALGFTDAHFARVDEVTAEFVTAGFDAARTYGIEGPAQFTLRAAEMLGVDVPDAVYAGVLAIARETEQEPTLLGAGSHLLTVATA